MFLKKFEIIRNEMRIAVHILGYNVNRFIGLAIENASPNVEKIYVAYSKYPWTYDKSAKDKYINPTTIEIIKNSDKFEKVEIIEGCWENEESMRNECLQRAKADGYDWLIIQDADEFYTKNSWKNLINIMNSEIDADQIITTGYNFWKSSEYVLIDNKNSMKSRYGSFAIRCKDYVEFTERRLTNVSKNFMADAPCYHYGYVMSDSELLEKISTWGHTRDFKHSRWLKYKWFNWSESTRNLHPVYPVMWKCARRFPLEQPEFATNFIIQNNKNYEFLSYKKLISNILYDVEANLRHYYRITKRFLKNNLSN